MGITGHKQERITKYRQILGVSELSDLSELKKRYTALHEKFQGQLRSDNETVVQKGRRNMQLLDKSYSALAEDIRSRSGTMDSTMQADVQNKNVSMEIDSMRVGFQVLRGGSKFFVVERSRVAGLGSTRTNNILSSSWPAGKLTIYNDHLELSCLLGSHEVNFSNVSAIDKVWYVPFWFRVKQKDRDAESVHIFGWGLGSKLKDCARKNRLSLKLDY